MQSNRHASLRALCAAAGLLALGATPLLADGDGPSAGAYLESDGVVLGATTTFSLRSPSVGSPAILAFGFNPGAVVLGGAFPVLHVGLPVFLIPGTIDTTGRMQVAAAITPALAGSSIFLQGAVVDLSTGSILGSNAIEVSPGGPVAPFASVTSTLPPSTAIGAGLDVDWADLDKDGNFDVLVANDGTGNVVNLLMNQGAGAFVDQLAARFPFAAQIPTSTIEAGDVNNDGFEDIFIGGGQDVAVPAANLLLLNDGSGNFTIDPSFPGGAGVPLDAEFGDVDGDGDLDLVIANTQDQDHLGEVPDGVELYLNSGGVFVPDASFAVLSSTDPHGSGGSVALGDLDNDGDLDLFIARADTLLGGVQNQHLVNDGSGVFTDVTATSVPAMLDNSHEADLADFNGDGFLDVFIANSISSVPNAAHLLINLGVGPLGHAVFADRSIDVPADFGPGTDVRLGLDVGDVEGDGDPDVVVSIHHLFGPFGPAGESVLLINQGGLQGGAAGVFALDPNFVPLGAPFVSADAAFGDMDNDGDLDVYLGNDGDLFGSIPPQDILLRNDV